MNTLQASKGQSTSSILTSSITDPVHSVAPQTSTSIPSSTTPPPAQGQTASSIAMSTPMSISSTNTSPAGGGKQESISWRLLFAHTPSSFQIVYKFWRPFSNKMRCICRLNPALKSI
ncbi:PREDICTED: uncharacterized protein LOC107330460 isoform X2 [Acropora digitifera]|uniref:uncharacterized protein LOC107330460 isoform X2 n=1 Tax=Acropora digitifera TaxID=70779 RepID=UPI00077A725F|nr:PREDICTED: uncharacterized protein LOC107330460 isoform X2 [Acropora digitifera]